MSQRVHLEALLNRKTLRRKIWIWPHMSHEGKPVKTVDYFSLILFLFSWFWSTSDHTGLPLDPEPHEWRLQFSKKKKQKTNNWTIMTFTVIKQVDVHWLMDLLLWSGWWSHWSHVPQLQEHSKWNLRTFGSTSGFYRLVFRWHHCGTERVF